MNDTEEIVETMVKASVITALFSLVVGAVMFLIILPLALLKGWILHLILGWFLVPVCPAVAKLTVYHLAGLALITGILNPSKPATEEERKENWKIIGHEILSVLFALVSAYLIKVLFI